jgi:hypothetical protein
MNTPTPWPAVTFINRFGQLQSGQVAHSDNIETVVAIEGRPRMVPTPYGLKEMSTVYVTVRNEFIRKYA